MTNRLLSLGLWTGLSLSAALPLAADDIVARIGDREIRIDEYESRAQALRRTGYDHLTTYDLDAKRQILGGLVAQELLIQEGERRGVADDPEIARDLARMERRTLMNALYDREALTGDYDSATEEELRDFFHARDLDVEVLSRHIVCRTEEEARQVHAALTSGADFVALVAQHSTPSIQRRFGPSGNVGWFRLGEVYEELREAMRSMPVGSLCPEPMESEVGFHVWELLDRRDIDFEASREFIAERLRVQKRADDMQAYIDGLRQRYAVTIHEEALRTLAAIPEGVTTFDGPDRTLIEWDGDRLTIAGYMDRVARDLALHPAAADSARLRKAVDNQAGQRVMMDEARRLGLDEEPHVRAPQDRRRRELFSRWLFEDVRRDAVADTSTANVRGFYEQNLDLFTRTDGTVAPFDLVANSIRSLLVRDAETRRMDAYIDSLRQAHAASIVVYDAVLDRALPEGIDLSIPAAEVFAE
jgi:peptidyl-prolyl cis-trans isomerase C